MNITKNDISFKMLLNKMGKKSRNRANRCKPSDNLGILDLKYLFSVRQLFDNYPIEVRDARCVEYIYNTINRDNIDPADVQRLSELIITMDIFDDDPQEATNLIQWAAIFNITSRQSGLSVPLLIEAYYNSRIHRERFIDNIIQ